MFFKTKQIVTISINNSELTFIAWNTSIRFLQMPSHALKLRRALQKSLCMNGSKIFLQAFYQYKLQNNEIINLTIFNTTQIEIVIESFLNHYKINNPEIYISFNSDLCEKFINNECIEFKDNINYEKIYLNGNCYVIGIKQYLLFQYYLIFNKLNLNLVKISTDLINSLNFDLANYITNYEIIGNQDKNKIIESLALFK